MKDIAIIVTPRIEYFENYEILLTSEFKLKYFKKDKTNYRIYDIVVYSYDSDSRSELSAKDVSRISFKFECREYYDNHYFRLGKNIDEFCTGDLTLTNVSLRRKDGTELFDFSKVYLNEEKANQNNYSGKRSLIIDSHTIELIRNYVVNKPPISYFLWTNKTKLKVLIDGLTEIYNLIDNFSHVDTFESYDISIHHNVVSKIGGDDRYYEDKVYSINYMDGYIGKWFSKKEINLHRESAYTSYFEEVNPYERFVDEENELKEEAYKKYSKEHHLHYHMASLLDFLRFQSIEDISFIEDPKVQWDMRYCDFLINNWHLKEVTNWIHQKWYECKRKYHFLAFEKCFLTSLSNFNL